MTHLSRSISLLTLSMLVSGCIYWPTQYYKPSGTGEHSSGWSDYLKGPCGGPDHHVVVEVEEGLAISIHSGLDRSKKENTTKLSSLAFNFSLGPEHHLQFEEPFIEIRSNINGQIIRKTIPEFFFKRPYIIVGDPKNEIDFEFPIKGNFSESVKTHSISNNQIVAWVRYSFSPTEKLIGGSIPSSGYNSFQRFMLSSWQLHRGYRTSIDVADIDLETFYLHFPRIFFDGKLTLLPKIKVELTDEWVRYPLLC